ncbi:MAG: hypothetical protein GX442_04135 [Candidatus Riflebacteria bacterium]|nr:hypothetical protein [Candidatus Riflebacteria bacterium]
MRVLVDGKEVLAWVRSDSTARECCRFQGKADETSMVERGPGDFSPAPGLAHVYPVKAGQKVTLITKGGFEPATFLRVEGPFGDATLDDFLSGR